ncbi:glycerophosphodiester phosphodiesterase [Phycicoccus endophyticus]|uniref:Glycerophosphodiester phosphodiesterase n=1 Tax=Phycicoccus endophyticus TaxID=1690220 RepID=A0A7G9R3E2_9MICO|nr:glycerophosphodiester phosphodiesterase family protein [Phycicoccus endophyticus]NHI19873.1 glycerophosphodiester phosphodiesterase [Phycicoccus endophyticus]QNN50117.1 glycerophosphodiester phosphodiesterase [Phycicoccus endophyticus]GGL27865.1 glycerophosphoryl diester phosphodiesterase [Phycicoccus endophyticus]
MRADDYAYLRAPRPIALAHRGGAGLAENVGLENTLAAFRRAAALGYRYLETDVHATRDGRVVAFHDGSLDRVTDASGAIADLPWERVRRARVGGVEPVPLLEELLEELPEARVNIDVKADSALGPTLEVLRRQRALDRVCLGSFSPRRIRAVRRALGPGVATAAGQVGTALLRFSPPLLSALLHTPAPVLQVPGEHVVAGRPVTLVTPGLVRRAHALGKQVHVWFHGPQEENAAEYHRLLDLGVDGLVADRVDLLAAVLAERGRPLVAAPGG